MEIYGYCRRSTILLKCWNVVYLGAHGGKGVIARAAIHSHSSSCHCHCHSVTDSLRPRTVFIRSIIGHKILPKSSVYICMAPTGRGQVLI